MWWENASHFSSPFTASRCTWHLIYLILLLNALLTTHSQKLPPLDFPHLCKIRSAFVHWLMTVAVRPKSQQPEHHNRAFACVHSCLHTVAQIDDCIHRWSFGWKRGAPTPTGLGQKASHLRSSVLRSRFEVVVRVFHTHTSSRNHWQAVVVY